MLKLVKLSPLPPPFYEGTQEAFGVTRDWMSNATHTWQKNFNWEKYEKKINQYPQYHGTVSGQDGDEYRLHYVHLPSKNPKAIPLLLIHGWPGSFVEFYPMIPYLCDHFHIVIPSLPGYTFSDDPPLDRDFDFMDVAYLTNELMVKLGYKKYIAQGGDLGYFIGKLLAVFFTEHCVGVHFNLIFLTQRPELPEVSGLSTQEQVGFARGMAFIVNGTAYANEHATRPSTIAHALSASPVALLAWIGEKYIEWSDQRPSTEDILDIVSLWWLTQTFPTSIYPYRALFVGKWPAYWNSLLKGEPLYVKAPMGYSYFPMEIVPTPESWARMTGNLVHFSRHYSGGHFAATEKPKELAQDVIGFANVAWRKY
jgi:microsomal epoxide hydrolase